MTMTSDDRIARIEVRFDQFEDRIDRRFNMQMQVNVAMWATTMLAVLATLAAVLFRS